MTPTKASVVVFTEFQSINLMLWLFWFQDAGNKDIQTVQALTLTLFLHQSVWQLQSHRPIGGERHGHDKESRCSWLRVATRRRENASSWCNRRMIEVKNEGKLLTLVFFIQPLYTWSKSAKYIKNTRNQQTTGPRSRRMILSVVEPLTSCKKTFRSSSQEAAAVIIRLERSTTRWR